MGQQNKAFPLAFCQRTLPLPFDPTALDPAPPVLTCGLHSGCALAAPGPCRPLGSSSVMSLAQRPFLASLGALSSSLLKVLGLFPSGLPQEYSPLLPRLHCLYNSVFPCPAPARQQHLKPPQHSAQGLPAFGPLFTCCWLTAGSRWSWVPSRGQNAAAQPRPLLPPGKIVSSSHLKSQGRSTHNLALPTQACATQLGWVNL